MAKIQTLFPIRGSLGDVTFYQVNGQCYARMKTSLNKKRFYSDKAYSGLPMMRVKNFGRASKLASPVYHTLAKEQKDKALFNELTALAHKWLWKAMSEEDVIVLLKKALAERVAEKKVQPEPAPARVTEAAPPAAIAIEKAYPPLELPERPTAILSKWWVSSQGRLYRCLLESNTGLLQQALQPLRPGWLRSCPMRE